MFTVITTGTAPLSYQWKKGSVNIGTNSAVANLTISNAQAANAGSYTVTVSNSVGSVTSIPATLTVNTGNLANSVTQFGITWTFDKAYPVGQFVNGDYWVIGPLKIISIDPLSVVVASQNNRVINGAMLNPAINLLQGYDSQMMGTEGRCWDAGLNVARPNGSALSASNPLVINVPASLASSISRAEPQGALNVLTIAVLTVLNEVPAADAFRPPFVGTNKRIKHTLSDVNANLLPKLAMPSGVWSTVTEVSARFEKPWVEHMLDWQKQLFCPPNNMPNYGREIAYYVSDASLMLLLDVDQETKTLLMKRFIQLGLDYYGMLQEPNGRTTWRADGGHMSGRVFPILLAGYLLGDQDMLGIMQKSGQYAYQGGYFEGNLPPDYIHFGEIDQTFFVTQRDVDRTHGLLGPWTPDPRAPAVPYETSDIGMAEWGIGHTPFPQGDNKEWTATYRLVNTPAWSGFILSSRILGITNRWNHPPLFAYMDRWVEHGEEAGLTDLQKRMWATYRASYQ